MKRNIIRYGNWVKVGNKWMYDGDEGVATVLSPEGETFEEYLLNKLEETEKEKEELREYFERNECFSREWSTKVQEAGGA